LFSKKLKKEAGEMKPIFMSTAISKIGEEKANKIWDMMETSSRYSFNCIDGDQEILTKTGTYSIRNIVANPHLYEVAYTDTQCSNLKYEIPDFVANKGVKEVWTLELSNGKILSATPDHKFLSNGEWIQLKDIVEKGLSFDETEKT
jgi:intein/homing endonuclease